MSQPQSHSDPLLEFSTEPAASPTPLPEPEQVVETPPVSMATQPGMAAADDLVGMRERVDQLEKALVQSAEDLRALRSEVATLVSLAGDNRQRTRRNVSVVPFASMPSSRTTRVASAIAGVVLGVTIGMWIWKATGSEPLLPAAPVAIASERSASPQSSPVPVTSPPASQPTQRAIVPAAAVIPPHNAPERPAPRRVEYVGTLTIDSEPAGQVFIDRRPAGRTPLRAEALKAGSHLVWIEQDGYQRFTRVVRVPADRVTRLVADLEPAQR